MSAPNSFMPVPNHWESTHFTGITLNDQKFLYCPVGNIVSWSPGDHDNKWCHWCKKFFNELDNKSIGGIRLTGVNKVDVLEVDIPEITQPKHTVGCTGNPYNCHNMCSCGCHHE